MKEKRIPFLRPEHIVKERERNAPIFLPVGVLEWHGPHLPLGVDGLRAEAAALYLAGMIGGVVLPVFYLGTERERSSSMLKNIGFSGEEFVVGMDFPGNSLKSLYFREETFAVFLRDLLEMIVTKWLFKNIVIVNGHGGENHLSVLQRLIREFTGRKLCRIILLMPMLDYPSSSWSHATLEETATMMFLWPETVNLKVLPPKKKKLKNLDWAIVDDQTFRGKPQSDFTVSRKEDPRIATREAGRKFWVKTIKQLADYLKKQLK